MKNICLFAGFNPHGKIQPSVTYLLRELSQIADIYYMADCTTDETEWTKIAPFVKQKHSYRHEKYDFGSWQELINKLGYDKLQEYDRLILCNDSVFGPLFNLQSIFDTMEEKNVDFWGITKNTFLEKEHIQSYFVVLKKHVFESQVFRNFFKNVKKEQTKYDVVLNYELNLTKLLQQAGFSYDVLIDNAKINCFITKQQFFNPLDPCLYWKQILKLGSPFLKKALFVPNNLPYKESLSGWDRFISSYSGYDIALIKDFIAMHKNFTIFSKEKRNNQRIIKFLGIPVFRYKK
uniref:Glycosyl transferase n=1 Tax=uncultured Elusimicrobia bacterium TaxID=699876 RepID=A0A650ENB7_9BACT|nr:hypothetical protein Elusimicrob1349_1580 [uncultured Elusimicrobia bacterium]